MEAGQPSAERSPCGSDVGLTHLALLVRNTQESVQFYRRYAQLAVVHERSDGSRRVVWLSDLRRTFVLVLLEADRVEDRLEGMSHIGVGCESRAEVDRLCDSARQEGRLALGPTDSGPPVGYWAILHDPDGHNLELSYGQEVARAVSAAQRASEGGARR